MGAKCEAKIITVSTNFSIFFQMTRMNAFLIFHFLIWTSAWNNNNNRLCLIVISIAVVKKDEFQCKYLMAYKIDDGT